MEETDAGNGTGTQGCELERSGDGGLDEVQMHLACLPERYMRAKFSLSAYMFCWAVVKLCQVRHVAFESTIWSNEQYLYALQ